MAILQACCEGQPISAGLPGSKQTLGEAVYPIFMSYLDSSGAVNGIPAGTVLDEAYYLGKVNNIVNEDRWTMFPKMTTYVAAPAAPDTEDQDGITKMTGFNTPQPMTWDHTAGASFSQLISAYRAQGCNQIGVIFVTRGFHITGKADGLGNLLCEKIEDSTISAVYQREQNKATAKVQVSVTPDTLEDDACHDWINACNVEFSAKNWFPKSPIQVVGNEISNATQTTIVVDLQSMMSGYGSKYPTEGLDETAFSYDDGVTDSTVFNSTTSASVVLTSAIPVVGQPGQYTLTMSLAQTALDIILIDLSVVGLSMQTLSVELDA